jgi:ATP-dependent DNA helicase RecG
MHYYLAVLSRTELQSLLARLDGEPADALESETLDCKQWDPNPRERDRQVRALRETVVCFANARGGTVVLGVADRKRTRREALLGIGRLDLVDLRRAIYDGTSPHILVEIDEFDEEGVRLAAIRVPRGLPPHTTSEGLAQIRVGKECKPLTGAELARLMTGSAHRDPSAELLPGSGIEDLEAGAVAGLRRALESRDGQVDLSRQPTVEILGALGLLREGSLTLAAVLLLGSPSALRRWAPYHEVTFLRLRSSAHYDVRHDLRGPVLPLLDETQALLSAHLKVAPVQYDLFAEFELPDLSWWTAREAILNAICHRDYFLRQSIQIEVRAESIVVTSPGGFLGGITPENVLRHQPVRRNPLLAQAFQMLGLVNRLGLGVDRIYQDLLTLGKGMPRFEATESEVRLTLPTRTDARFARFVASERRHGRELDLDDLILLRGVSDFGALDRWAATRLLQYSSDDQGAARLVSLRERGYLQPSGRGRGTAYHFPAKLSDVLRGRQATNLDLPLDQEAVRLRVLAVLAERGEVTNQDVRRFSGLSRTQVLRLMKSLLAEGAVALSGSGRGAVYRAGLAGPARKSTR